MFKVSKIFNQCKIVGLKVLLLFRIEKLKHYKSGQLQQQMHSCFFGENLSLVSYVSEKNLN